MLTKFPWQWEWSIIYSVDTTTDHDPDHWPLIRPTESPKWQQTEDDDCYDLDRLGGDWEGGHHAKWCAYLNQEEFDKFIDTTGLYADDVETMGSLGAPNMGLGVVPAISFTDEGVGDTYFAYAYVTPVPVGLKRPENEDYSEDQWDFVRREVLQHYGF